ncbi:MAG: sigma-70 family RNA polymerase sigma factor [Candidatus Omnitrophota bacterium]|nr:sigma-70 family RNA polymerase sigma factor [Candidatus Omnitrophota bacterium]
MEAIRTYLKEIRNIPLLTAKEEIELSRRVRKGDKHARERMIRSNLRLVISIAKRYGHLGIPLMDLIEEGNMGLMKAVEKFNPRKGYRFSTYAAWWIRQSITRSIADQGKMIRVPVYVNELMSKWKKVSERLTHELKRTPRDEEVAKKMRLPRDKADQISVWLSVKTSSLEAPIGEEGENEVMDLIENQKAVAPDEEITRFLDKERIAGLLGIMSSREKEILDMRFGLVDGKIHTLAEVAKKLGVSRERVRQIEEAALRKLRKFVQQQEKAAEECLS